MPNIADELTTLSLRNYFALQLPADENLKLKYFLNWLFVYCCFFHCIFIVR